MASSLEGNKIFAAILTAGIIAVGAGVASGIIYHAEELDEPAYKVALTESTAVDAVAEEVPSEPIGVLLASADLASGQKLAKKCGTCHSFDEGGANKVGPPLWDIVNRTIGSVDGFGYSSVLSEHGGVWDFESLNGFLLKPKEWAPGTKMNFVGFKKDGDRADMIEYLRSLSTSPAPLPEG